jgi:hypothetical protein
MKVGEAWLSFNSGEYRHSVLICCCGSLIFVSIWMEINIRIVHRDFSPERLVFEVRYGWSIVTSRFSIGSRAEKTRKCRRERSSPNCSLFLSRYVGSPTANITLLFKPRWRGLLRFLTKVTLRNRDLAACCATRVVGVLRTPFSGWALLSTNVRVLRTQYNALIVISLCLDLTLV